jgi:putative oxidoreductase
MKKFFSTQPLFFNGGLFLIRIALGFFMVFHGWEIFSKAKMDEYASWDTFKNSFSPVFMVYLGKGAELVGGILLMVGLLTRLGALMIIFTMAYIALIVGKAIVWYDDQYPFLFVLLALVFFFTGPGKYSLDAAMQTKKY